MNESLLPTSASNAILMPCHLYSPAQPACQDFNQEDEDRRPQENRPGNERALNRLQVERPRRAHPETKIKLNDVPFFKTFYLLAEAFVSATPSPPFSKILSSSPASWMRCTRTSSAALSALSLGRIMPT